jgi:hypothetical protein
MSHPTNPEADASAAPRAEQMATAVVAWIEANLGPVIAIERQPRWRPAWFVDSVGDDGPLHLYVRGAREGAGNVYSLQQEAAVLQVLEAHGIPAPHVHGVIDEPSAIVMDRLPGGVNLATVEDEAERRAILDDYVGILARIHAIPPAAFEAAGLATPETPEGVALGWFNRVEDRFRAAKKRPEPLLEFCLQWVRRNIPPHRSQPCFILCDPAQFMFDQGRVSGVLDVEFAHIGEAAHDLASLRLRDMSEPLGDVGGALRRYEALTGVPLDPGLIDFHTVKWVLCTPLSLVVTLHAPPAAAELMQYVEWFHQYSLIGVEGIANILGVSLAEAAPLELAPTRYAGVHDTLAPTIRGLAAGDETARFRRDRTAVTAEYLRRADTYGAAIEAADLDDIAALLGERPADWRAGDTALEAFVLAAGPEHDAALVRLFHRRAMRQMQLLEPILNRTKSIAHLPPLSELLGPR